MELIQSAALCSTGSGICRLPARNWKCRAWRSPCGARAENESRKFCWKKRPARSAAERKAVTEFSSHDPLPGDPWLLDNFVLVRWNRGGLALRRSGAVAFSRETKRASRSTPRSLVATSGAFARHRFARHEHGRYPRPPLTDAPTAAPIRIYRIFLSL